MFLIFAGQCYYPSAGAGSLVTTSDSFDKAVMLASKLMGLWAIPAKEDWMWGDEIDSDVADKIEWVHVLDLHTMTIVYKLGDEPYGGESPYSRFASAECEIFIE